MSGPPPLIQMSGIRLDLGGTRGALLDGAEMAVSRGERLALVGRNGSGKSTLMKIAAGVVQPDAGDIFIQPGTTVGLLPQEPDFSGYQTTLDAASGDLQDGEDPWRARYLLEQLGLDGTENPANLSGGELRRVALARCLAPEPDILLLDEPTNHLDLPAIEWLEQELDASQSALVLISHDRRFLSTLTRSLIWVDRGKTNRLGKGFAHFEDWRDELLAQEELEAHKLDRKIVREEHWLTHGVSGRRKRNVRRLGNLHNLREQARTRLRPQGGAKVEIVADSGGGAQVIKAEGLSKSFGDRQIVRDFSMLVPKGSRIGIVGANGAGKTTLIRMLLGQLEPDDGKLTLGTGIELAEMDQSRDSLSPDLTLRDALSDGADHMEFAGAKRHVMGVMKDFLFQPEQARSPLASLSGGERARVMLARALAKPSNLMVLDEPTNDLDLETLELLQELLADYPGTILLVSHDRDFLDRVATSTIMSEGNGKWQEYAGGYSDMLAQRGEGVTARAAQSDKAAPKSAEKPSRPAAKPAQPRQKLSFKQKHALETLPSRMEEQQQEITALEAELADPQLFNRDANKFQSASTRLTAAQAELEQMEEEWLELEMLREELEA